MILHLAMRSLRHRRNTLILTLFSLAVSVALILGIDHLRREARSSFTQTVSGIDLIVGARSGAINLLLYSVFRIGNATNNLSWDSFQMLQQHPQVAWAVPLSLGDSHRGYRVLGTDSRYFEHFRYGQKQSLTLAQGQAFSAAYEAVLGADVARALGYQLGDRITIAHGLSDTSFSQHKDHPFTIVGILGRTGTPVDQTVHVSLESIEAIHAGWRPSDPLASGALKPTSITAALVGLKSRIAAFSVQRLVNDYPDEPLMAILPGATLSELWRMLGMFEQLLLVIAGLVLLATLVGMLSLLLASIRERQRELALLRAMGAGMPLLIGLILLETLLLSSGGALLGFALLWLTLTLGQTAIADQFGLFINAWPLHAETPLLLLGMVGLATLLAVIPALMAYRGSLAEQLTVRR